MGSVDDARKGPTRETGKRLYVSDKDYQDQIRRGTISGYDAGLLPWSEFEKPYWEDSYEEMEYFMWNWPGFAPWRWELNFDNPSLPTSLQDSGGGLLVFECQVYGGFCPGETRCVTIDCSHPVTGVQFSQSYFEREFSLSLASPTSLCITADEDAGGGVEVDIFMRTEGGVVGSNDDILIGTAQDCEDCDTADPLTFDEDTLPSTVADSTNYRLEILDGVGPFSWSVSAPDSPDVSLQWAGGSRRYNYLQVVDGCGSINVTVIDSCGTTAVAALRSVDGSWTLCQGVGRGGSNCECGGAGTDIEGPTYLTDSGDEFEFGSGGRTWKLDRTASNDCDGLGFPSCCKDQNPDCSPSSECYPSGAAGATCSGITEPCYNDCGSKGATPICGTTVRTGDSVAMYLWICT